MGAPANIAPLGNVTYETRLKCNEVYDYAKSIGRAPRYMWGWGPNPEHNSRRAIDFMINTKAEGDAIRAYLWANRARLRVKHIIWWQHITSTVTQPGVVRKMANRGNTTANHMDHVHVLFLDDGYKAPSAGSPSTKPKPKPKPKPTSSVKKVRTLYKGVKGKDVQRLQSEMNRVFPAYSRLAKDGSFGPATDKVVREFQRRVGLKADGRVGPATRAAMKKRGVRL